MKKNPNVPKDSVRARIYENLGISFERIGRGLYLTKDEDCLLLEGDGRNLSFLDNASIDCIITDHPWEDDKSNKGGTRDFATYDCFKYTQEDFDEKARVLKDGSFLCEVIPAENENNFEYLYQLKKMALKAGFRYYAKVAWKKGTFVSNTGRKAKNTEDLMIFSKGKPRALKLDKQRGLDAAGNPTRFMSGTNGMLPTDFDIPEVFDVQAIPNSKKRLKSEKPVALFEQLLEYLTKDGELVLDQFAGSGVVGEACMKKNRKAILIEKAYERVQAIQQRLGLVSAVNITEVVA